MTTAPVSFSVDGPGSVQVELQIGYVNIVSSHRADVVVAVSPSNSQSADDRAAVKQIDVNRSGSLISVIGTYRWNLFGTRGSIDLQIDVPAAFAVSAHIKFGSLLVFGPVGAVRAKVDYGDVNIERAEQIELRGGHGEMRIGQVEGEAKITLGSGSLRVDRVGGDLKVEGGHGSVDVKSVAGDVDIDAAGTIELGSVGGALAVRSTYGGVRIRELARGIAHIEASHGTVHLGVAKRIAVWLDASSQRGAVRSELAPDPGPATDEETLELSVRTNHGDIIVQRSSSDSDPTHQSEGANS